MGATSYRYTYMGAFEGTTRHIYVPSSWFWSVRFSPLMVLVPVMLPLKSGKFVRSIRQATSGMAVQRICDSNAAEAPRPSLQGWLAAPMLGSRFVST
jgi:hypothetical protein